jgi:hypothetical protein
VNKKAQMIARAMAKPEVHGLLSSILKEAGAGDLWEKLRDQLPAPKRAKMAVDEHFKGPIDRKKWDQLIVMTADFPEVLRQLAKHPKADDRMVQHVKQMVELNKAPPAGKVESSRVSGTTYEVRDLPGGKLGCTCPDWRFRGLSVAAYECKHIKAFKDGKTKAASFNAATVAFFNGLRTLGENAQKMREDEFGSGESPFSNMLTLDEEPTFYNPRPAAPIDEPEIILGGRR